MSKPTPATIGGQAVIEGVMMRNKEIYAMAVRTPDKSISLVKKDLSPISNKHKLFKLPIIRGVVAFVDSFILGMEILQTSANLAGMEEETENPSKFEQWITKTFGDRLNDILIGISMILGVLISVSLFMLLPVFISSFLNPWLGGNTWALSFIEGFIRILLFILYINFVSRMEDMKRIFAYHGAEHKTINCFESGEQLTVENVRKHTRLHKRCGTSFLLIVMLVSMITFMFVQTDVVWMRFALRILFVPFIAGISFEVIKWAGRSQGTLVDIISYPGMLMQRLTTKEPTDDQIEVAIAAMNEVVKYANK